MNGFLQWLHQLDFSSLISTLLLVAASLVCIVFHETSHGRVACWLGDPTAKNAGRLSLNPLRHIDWVGLVMMAVLKFGWAKPVPVDARNFRHPKRDMALTALAGPVSNVLLTYVALLIRSALLFFLLEKQAGVAVEYAVVFTEYVGIISAGLAVFNLIPISPLDGSKVLMAVLPDRAYFQLMQYERYGMLVLMALLLTSVLDKPLIFLRTGLLDMLQPLAWFPYTLLHQIFG